MFDIILSYCMIFRLMWYVYKMIVNEVYLIILWVYLK